MMAPPHCARVRTDGKFLSIDGERFLVKGVTYGTFKPDRDGYQFPADHIVTADFASMARAGINTVRIYTTPSPALLDLAAQHGLRLMVGLWWPQHVAFLEDWRTARRTRRDLVRQMRELSAHPAVALFALGNEIPAAIVRWHGRSRVERYLQDLYDDAKSAAPDSLFTYVNFPPTEYLDLPFLDICAFNVYLHREQDLREYIARLHHVAGNRPLLMAEAGADSIRHTRDEHASLTAMQLRAAFEEGACGAIAFTWTDDWWCGGYQVEDWAFGLVDAARTSKPALAAVSHVYADAPFRASERARWPRVSVVVCAYNAADTLEDCLTSLERLTYPDYEVLVVNDGSRDATAEIARRHRAVNVIEVPNGGLSTARNIGLARATGDVVAYTDADARVDPNWLTFLVQPFLTSDVVAVGGPNVVPADDPPLAQCVARAPGSPIPVLLDHRIAEHVPGCNLAVRRSALAAIGGFNPIYLRAGDDVDVCWRLQERGGRIGFAPAALVWHHHRKTIRQYWRQQVGYGEGETWLQPHHPTRFSGRHILWRGTIYSPVPAVAALTEQRVNTGTWGTAAFPSVYRTGVTGTAFVLHTPGWLLASIGLLITGGLLTSAYAWSALLIAAGAAGLTLTIVQSFRYARASDIKDLPAIWNVSTAINRVGYQVIIAWLHVLQPFARLHGRIRGMLHRRPHAVRHATVNADVGPAFRDIWRALTAMVIPWQQQFWTESGTAAESLLTRLVERLRSARPGSQIVVDEGWSHDVDVALDGVWGHTHVRLVVEHHGHGKCLTRAALRIRPSAVLVTVALGTCPLLPVAVALLSQPAARQTVLAVTALLATLLAFAGHRLARNLALVDRIIGAVMTDCGLQVVRPGRKPSRGVRDGELTESMPA